MKRRILLISVAVASTAALAACGAGGGQTDSAEDYPTKNIEMLVGFAPGGHNDVVARKFAEGLTEELGQRVLVVNREGGGGAIASAEAAKGSTDGYEVLFAPTGAFTSTMLQQDVSYEIEDFRSVMPVAENTFVIAVPDSSPIQTFDDLLEIDDRITFSAFGEGHPTHIVGQGIAMDNDLDAELVAYPGSPPALQAIVNGDVTFGVQDITSALARIRSGEIRALAVTTDYVPTAMEEIDPDIPTLSDYGLDHLLFGGSQALAVKKDTPEEIVLKLREASTTVVTSDEFVSFIEDSGGVVPDVDGEEWFASYMPSELERFRELYAELGIPLNE